MCGGFIEEVVRVCVVVSVEDGLVVFGFGFYLVDVLL